MLTKVNKMVSQKGYISETTSTFQLGYCGPYDWVGEDILILNDLLFPFSIIAKTEVVALKISKNDLQNKIPSEFKNLLEEQSKDRNRWLQDRVKAITNTSHIIYKQDHKQTVYDTVMNQLCSQHPQATSNAVKSFTRHHISLSGTDNSGKIIKRVSTNHRKSYQPLSVSKNKDILGINIPSSNPIEKGVHFASNTKVSNKASFSGWPSEGRFEYRNVSTDSVYSNIFSKMKNNPLSNSFWKKPSIEMSFNNMKLTKNGRIDFRSVNLANKKVNSSVHHQSQKRPNTQLDYASTPNPIILSDYSEYK
jgi:hypothetical protein